MSLVSVYLKLKKTTVKYKRICFLRENILLHRAKLLSMELLSPLSIFCLLDETMNNK